MEEDYVAEPEQIARKFLLDENIF
jgi:hypothetical protein